jgi:hypothetical protein
MNCLTGSSNSITLLTTIKLRRKSLAFLSVTLMFLIIIIISVPTNLIVAYATTAATTTATTDDGGGQQPLKSKLLRAMQSNDPGNYKLGVIVDLSSTTAKACTDLLSSMCVVKIDGKVINTGTKTIQIRNETQRNLVMLANFYDPANSLIEADGALIYAKTLMPDNNNNNNNTSTFSVFIGIDPNDVLKTKADLKKIDHIVYRVELP